MQFTGDPVVSRGVCERRFDVTVDESVVPGILWTPEDAIGSRPLVLIGHGGSQHKRAPNVLALARRLVRHLGYAAAAIDGPMHGDRVEGGNELTLDSLRVRLNEQDPNVVAHRFRQARGEWRGTLDELRKLDEVGAGPVGYWGLSMGTIFGGPLVAEEPRIGVAVLGLMGITAPSHYKPRISGAAGRITCPVLFLMQLEDELFARADCLALFDALATEDKRLHANPGKHPAVPVEEMHHSIDFLVKGLTGRGADPAATVPVAE